MNGKEEHYPDYPLFKGLQRPLEFMGIQAVLFQIFLLSNDHYASISDERCNMDGIDGITIFITMLMEGEF